MDSHDMDSRGQCPGGPPDDGARTPDRNRAVVWRNWALLLFDHLPVPTALCDAYGTVLLANPAMAAEWGTLPGRLTGRNALDLFRPKTPPRLHPLAEAVRLRRRSRYPIEVSWSTGTGIERHGELTVDLVSDTPDALPHLLLLLSVLDEPAPPAPEPGTHARVSPMEARILALAAGGSTNTQIATAVGLTVDGVNYHLGRLSRRWGTPNRTALVARAYVTGVLAPGAWPPEPSSAAPPASAPGPAAVAPTGHQATGAAVGPAVLLEDGDHVPRVARVDGKVRQRPM
ncbi:LuxR C-terminal-related transcriptional regulator [Kitasatospora sp. GP82]|uniref:helix-turn-helix transcriptional regulator n=1 Tax=Kitasatospora sp. GP82 TaxID=3035089 RepID=UPI00247CF40F|nr:DNA-binding CsgD family transcriptional regulator [Kitasatospora sp. GP82]